MTPVANEASVEKKNVIVLGAGEYRAIIVSFHALIRSMHQA